MKHKFLIVLLLSFSFPAISQLSLSPSAIEGTWQVIAVDVPTLFAYNKELQTFTPYATMEHALNNDATGETKKAVADLKKRLPLELAKYYLEINSNKSFLLNINEKIKSGSYAAFTSPPVPNVDSDEETFIQFVETYGYNGGIKLDDEKSRTPIWANAKTNSTGTLLVITHQTISLGATDFPCSYTLKKISKEEADAIKEKVRKAEEDKKKIEKEKAEQKEKADEEKNGKLYTAADKEPYYSGERETILKISERLYNTAIDYGAASGKYTVTILYTVNKDGTITDITVPTDPGSGLKDAVIQQIKRLPVMSPAEVNGQKVRFRVKKEFKFTLTGDE